MSDITPLYEGMNPYEIRREAERLIGEDRVPTATLYEIVRDFGDDCRPCTCTLACQPAVELIHEDSYCREEASARGLH